MFSYKNKGVRFTIYITSLVAKLKERPHAEGMLRCGRGGRQGDILREQNFVARGFVRFSYKS